jgi:hypothetical protein
MIFKSLQFVCLFLPDAMSPPYLAPFRQPIG